LRKKLTFFAITFFEHWKAFVMMPSALSSSRASSAFAALPRLPAAPKVAFYCVGIPPQPWVEGLQAALPEAEVYSWASGAAPADVGVV
jgi:hypothetical protein